MNKNESGMSPAHILSGLAASLSVCIILLTYQDPAYGNNDGISGKSPATAYAERIASGELGNSSLGILAIDSAGDTIIALNHEKLMIPASNMKIITTGLALNFLGDNYSFRTRIGYDGTICDGILYGDLYICGEGDPTLAADDSIAVPYERIFGRWAEMITGAGITKIEGNVIGDGRYFGGMGEEQSWQWDDCGTYYGTGISGLNFFENVQTFLVSPGKFAGDSLSIAASFPACPWMDYRYDCRTGEAGTGDRLYYFTSSLAPTGIVRGTFACDRSPKTLKCSNKFPEATCAEYFLDFLKRRGVECTGKAGDTGHVLSCSGTADPDSIIFIGETLSPELSRIAFETNHESNNLYADVLFNTLGKKFNPGKTGSASYSGNFSSSAAAVDVLLEKIGIDGKRARIRDGSGLSRQNLVSASFLCDFLSAMKDSEEFPAFLKSLPSPGSNGTLSEVMRTYDRSLTGRIILKSGSMTGVKCYSGYIMDENGEKPEIVFSILVNDTLLSQYRLQAVIDRLIYLISAGASRRSV